MCTLDMSDAHSRDSLLHFSQHAVVGGSLVYSVQVSSNFIWSGSNFHCSKPPGPVFCKIISN
jgi:hypothetical protein